MRWVAGLFVVLLLAVAGCGSSDDSGAPVTGIRVSDDDGYRGIKLDQPYVVPNVALTDTAGKPFDLATQQKRTLVFFGYTNCPDICQVVMSTIASAVTRLSDAERKQLQVAFVTTDPARDTRSALRTYLDRFNPDFVGVTGPMDRIVALAKPMGIDILKGQKLPSGGYEVEHTTNVIAVRAGRGRPGLDGQHVTVRHGHRPAQDPEGRLMTPFLTSLVGPGRSRARRRACGTSGPSRSGPTPWRSSWASSPPCGPGERRWVARGGDQRPDRRHRPLGGPRRTRRSAALPRRHRPRPLLRRGQATHRCARDLARWPRHLGRHRRRPARARGSTAAATASCCVRSRTPWRPACCSPR